MGQHLQFRDSQKLYHGGPVTACPRPSSLHPSPRGEPLQLRALRGARRATPLSIIEYYGIGNALINGWA
jgi:hypothetical protein